MKRPLDPTQAFRAQELLLARATDGLSPAEHAELAALGADDDVSFDLAAAAVDLATLPIEPLPAHLADKLLAQARPVPTTLAGVVPPRPLTAAPPPADIVPIRKRSRAPVIVAWIAAAAGLALAVGAWLWATQRETPQLATRGLADQRAALLASAGDTRTLAWKTTPDPAGTAASGDIVWSPSRQEGYMRFVGMQPNDPRLAQYQLWIFDKARDQQFPVDGGVFDIASTGEVIVRITAKLPVAEPVLFAVTVEKPGGVVVSKRERIVVTAS